MAKLSVERTRQHLKRSLDSDLALYEKYVPNPKVLAEYVEITKRTLLMVVEDVFNEKIEELTNQPMDKPDVPNTLYLVNNETEFRKDVLSPRG